MGFGLEVWEKERERENWKVADWTEEDEKTMSGATYEWIRMDADFEWIAAVAFDQPDFMWVSQLQRDRDVVAHDALRLFGPIGLRHHADHPHRHHFAQVIRHAVRGIERCSGGVNVGAGEFALFNASARLVYAAPIPAFQQLSS